MTQADQIRSYYRQMLARIEAVPGVMNAYAGTGLPLEYTGFGMPSTSRQTLRQSRGQAGAGFQMITPGYFDTFGVRMVRGRRFDEHDIAGAHG